MHTLKTDAQTTANTALPSCELVLPGQLGYKDSVILQESYVNKIVAGGELEKLILLEHPHVITLGSGFQKKNLLVSPEFLEQRGIALEESGRGGDITYHGPGQVVGYPILNLKEKPDLHLYLRNLEELMIRTVADFGITAGRKEGLTGIWVGDEKIGAIGVRVVRWISSHGFALNVDPDLSYFDYIIPCGIHQHGVTSMHKILRKKIPIEEVHVSLIAHFEKIFQRKVLREDR
jgi:lipoate-protein ligase B